MAIGLDDVDEMIQRELKVLLNGKDVGISARVKALATTERVRNEIASMMGIDTKLGAFLRLYLANDFRTVQFVVRSYICGIIAKDECS